MKVFKDLRTRINLVLSLLAMLASGSIYTIYDRHLDSVFVQMTALRVARIEQQLSTIVQFHRESLERIAKRRAIHPKINDNLDMWRADASQYLIHHPEYAALVLVNAKTGEGLSILLHEDLQISMKEHEIGDRMRGWLKAVGFTEETRITAPIEVSPDRQGFAYIQTIMRDDQLLGYVLAIIDTRQFFRKILPEPLTRGYRIRILDGETLLYDASPDAEAFADEFARTAVVRAGTDRSWTIHITPTRAQLASSRSFAPEILTLLFLTITGLTIYSLHLRRVSDQHYLALLETNSRLSESIAEGQAQQELLTAQSEKLERQRKAALNMAADAQAAQSEAEKAEMRFRRAIDAAPNGMMMVNRHGIISLINDEIERMFRYSRDELVGKPLETLVPERYRKAHPILREEFFCRPEARPMGKGRNLFALRKDGSEFPVEIGLNPVETDEGVFVLSSVVDITERTEAENFIRRSLKEKELLLREIHHRVKNNMQIISSLLRLQSGSIDNEDARALLKESEQRVRSMAKLHERLYQSDSFTEIDFRTYAHDLASELHRTYSIANRKIGLDLSIDDLALGLDQAIPCGLILNELISNAMKHAFCDAIDGVLCVRCAVEGELVKLEVSDNGCGLPEDFNSSKSSSLGFQIVETLTKQLGGSLSVNSESGTRIEVSFPLQDEEDATENNAVVNAQRSADPH